MPRNLYIIVAVGIDFTATGNSIVSQSQHSSVLNLISYFYSNRSMRYDAY